MKTIYMLIALLVMSFTILSAGNPMTIITKAHRYTYKISIYNDVSDLGPITPKEAFFDDSEPRPASEINRLSPITPKEATFEDIKAEFQTESINPLLLQKLVPQTPKEAGFEDTSLEKITSIDSFVPTSPMVAPFED